LGTDLKKKPSLIILEESFGAQFVGAAWGGIPLTPEYDIS